MPSRQSFEKNFPPLEGASEVLDHVGKQMVILLDRSEKEAWQFYLRALFFYQRQLKDTIALDTLIARGIAISEFLHDTAQDKPRKETMSAEESMAGITRYLRIDGRTEEEAVEQ